MINGTALYNIDKDPKQEINLAEKYPELVDELLQENEIFTSDAKFSTAYKELPVTIVGNNSQLETKLTIQHAIGEDIGIWKCEQVAAGIKNTNNTHALRIDNEGDYLISLRRWPKECSGPILGVPEENPKNLFEYKDIKPTKARISIANQILEKPILEGADEVVFTVHLQKGKTFLVNDFIEKEASYGVYYTYIQKVD